MKKLLISLILLSSCSTQKETVKNTTIITNNNISGIITDINKDIITINKDNEILSFDLEDIDINEFEVNDEVSIVYNQTGDQIKVISLILQNKAEKEDITYFIEGVIVKGTTYNQIIIDNQQGKTVTLKNIDVPIQFEGDLIPGMKVSATYDKNDTLLTFNILE